MTINVLVALSPLTCCNCGIVFGIPENHETNLRQSHKVFYCPAGHAQHFGGKTEAERLKDEKAELERRLQLTRESRDRQQELRFKTERRLIAQRAATTRIKRRAAAGTCPCCNRTFQALTRHMKQEHPDFVASAALEKEKVE